MNIEAEFREARETAERKKPAIPSEFGRSWVSEPVRYFLDQHMCEALAKAFRLMESTS